VNVLIVSGIFPPDRGGPASYVPALAAALAARGHRVEVICLSDRMDHEDGRRRYLVRRIRRRLFWPCRVAFTVFTIWRAALRSDLVYVNGLGAESALAALFAGRRTVHKIVGDYAWERAVGRGWFRGTLEEYQAAAKSLALRVIDGIRTFPLLLAAQIIVPSRYLRRVVEGWDIAPEKVRVVYNATENAEPAPRESHPKPLPEWPGRTLVTVGRLVRWKNVDALIRLLPELPGTRLVVAGDGHLRAELEELARTTGVSGRVVFLGDVPHREVRSYFEQADAFVLNSSYEGLPHVVLEAMSAGVPVIATDAGGTGEVVEHEVTGLLIPVGKAAALQAAIERLWLDPSLGRQLAAEAASRLAVRFDFGAMVAATEAILLRASEHAPHPQPIPAEERR
jgi:glycosyltransferase involved in cell wall biosynthesis